MFEHIADITEAFSVQFVLYIPDTNDWVTFQCTLDCIFLPVYNMELVQNTNTPDCECLYPHSSVHSILRQPDQCGVPKVVTDSFGRIA